MQLDNLITDNSRQNTRKSLMDVELSLTRKRKKRKEKGEPFLSRVSKKIDVKEV